MKSLTVFLFMTLLVANLFADSMVRKQYLPVDSDLDGVLDENDDCYKTPPGARVDDRGCANERVEVAKINLLINFEYDSVIIGPEYISEISKVAQFLNQYPLTTVVLEAHTDSVASRGYNKRLSDKRAQSVAAVLINRFNIDAKRVSSVGYGEDRPLVPNDSEENMAKNRRVVALISAVRN